MILIPSGRTIPPGEDYFHCVFDRDVSVCHIVIGYDCQHTGSRVGDGRDIDHQHLPWVTGQMALSGDKAHCANARSGHSRNTTRLDIGCIGSDSVSVAWCATL